MSEGKILKLSNTDKWNLYFITKWVHQEKNHLSERFEEAGIREKIQGW